MTDLAARREIALLRLVAQGVAGSRGVSPERAVQRLVCLQAQDYWSGLASVALRSRASIAAVEAALNAGTVVRGWPLRGTLHLVAASDLGWLRELLAGRELAAAAGREARLGIDAPLLGRAERIAVETLSCQGPSTRAQVTAAWQAGGIDTGGQRGYHLIWHLSLAGIVLFGPARNGQQLLALAGPQASAPAGFTRAAALEELARRYFAGHGPATPADLARWANLTAADTRLAVAAARPHLAAITSQDGTEYLLGPATQDELASCREEAEDVIALPGFDEMIFGYRDRTPTLPDDRAARVFPHRNGIPSCTVIVGGQVAATWRPAKRPGEVTEIAALTPLTEQVTRSAMARAAALA